LATSVHYHLEKSPTGTGKTRRPRDKLGMKAEFDRPRELLAVNFHRDCVLKRNSD